MTRRYVGHVDTVTPIPGRVVSFEEWLAMPESVQSVEVVVEARADRLTAAPALAVEVLSPGSGEADLVQKPKEYAAAGLRHLWLVDPETPEVVVRRWDGEAWVEVARASGSMPWWSRSPSRSPSPPTTC